jgi:hypothetical protein
MDGGRNDTKDAPVYRVARPALGSGLTVSPGGQQWLQRRRLVQPAFGRATAVYNSSAEWTGTTGGRIAAGVTIGPRERVMIVPPCQLRLPRHPAGTVGRGCEHIGPPPALRPRCFQRGGPSGLTNRGSDRRLQHACG